MNRQLIGCSVFFCCLFAGMIVWMCTYLNNNSDALFNNSYNSRQSVLTAVLLFVVPEDPMLLFPVRCDQNLSLAEQRIAEEIERQ